MHAYVERRGFIGARERGLYGVLPDAGPLPGELFLWPCGGYRLLAALHDVGTGDVVNVQARTVRNTHPKVRVPRGSRIAATLFANEAGLAVLRGSQIAGRRVLFGEGLTDFIALALAVELPVLSCAGTSVAAHAIGSWVRGQKLVVALDCDGSGEAAVEPVAQAAHSFGSVRVQRLRWPAGCKDACDVVTQRGINGLAAWLKAKLDG